MVLPQHRLRGSRGGRRCRASWIRSSPRRLAPGSHPLAVDGPQAADQRGITGGQEADCSVQQSPSWLRKEVTGALRWWGGGWLQATWALGGCGSGPSCPPWSSARGTGRALGPSGATAGSGGVSNRVLMPDGRTKGRRLWGPTDQEADEGCSQFAQLVRVAAQSPGGGSQGGFSFMGWGSGCRELLQLPCAVTASQ